MKLIIANSADLNDIVLDLIDDISGKNITVGIDPLLDKMIIDYLLENDNIKNIISLSNERSIEKVNSVNDALLSKFDLVIMNVKENGEYLDNYKNTPFSNIMTIKNDLMCVGPKKVMSSKRIILLSRGEAMARTVYDILNGLKTEENPSSIFIEHPSCCLICDKESASLV